MLHFQHYNFLRDRREFVKRGHYEKKHRECSFVLVVRSRAILFSFAGTLFILQMFSGAMKSRPLAKRLLWFSLRAVCLFIARSAKPLLYDMTEGCGESFLCG